MKKYILLMVVIMVFCAGAPPSSLQQQVSALREYTKRLKEDIKIEAEGEVLHYQKESFWDEEEFHEILNSKEEFEAKEIDSFEKDLERYNKSAVNPKVEFDEARRSTTLICDVKGAMYGTDSYDFHWLLGPLPFDLFQFKRSEKELNYEGEVDGVPTTIRLVFPYTIAHCHEHVWPR